MAAKRKKKRARARVTPRAKPGPFIMKIARSLEALRLDLETQRGEVARLAQMVTRLDPDGAAFGAVWKEIELLKARGSRRLVDNFEVRIVALELERTSYVHWEKHLAAARSVARELFTAIELAKKEQMAASELLAEIQRENEQRKKGKMQ